MPRASTICRVEKLSSYENRWSPFSIPFTSNGQGTDGQSKLLSFVHLPRAAVTLGGERNSFAGVHHPLSTVDYWPLYRELVPGLHPLLALLVLDHDDRRSFARLEVLEGCRGILT